MDLATLSTADHDLLARALAREKRSLGRLLSRAERDGVEFAALHTSLFPKVGQGLRVGFTGPPGAGKSTLVERYAMLRREQGDKVAIVAVDPSSPFTGGALLGDRVRMNRIALDPNCFVRSMASRGSFGGLARTTDEVADCLDAAGFDRIVLETVGVGQSEVDVAKAADVTLVVLVPGAGDAVQAMKAGLMEIADVFVVNKADRPGVERVLAELEEVLELRSDGKRPAIVQTVASNGEGIAQLNAAIEAFVVETKTTGEFERRRRQHLAQKVHRIVEETLRERLFQGKGLTRRVDEALAEKDRRSPYAIANDLLREAGVESSGDDWKRAPRGPRGDL